MPFSHGTHVASIALGELTTFGLVGFAGNFTDPGFLSKISNFISEFKVPVVNMSFAFGNQRDGMAPPEVSRIGLADLISSNPRSLFAVAAGNNGLDFEEDQYEDFPASFTFTNLLVVAATDQSEINEDRLLQAKLAPFSNRGARTVDLAAPGTDVEGAQIGGGIVKESGSSMATPMVVNLVLNMLNIKSDLEPQVVKEILMKTVLIHDLNNPWSLLSGGQVFPRRALKATEYVSKGMSVEAAALKAHQEVYLPGHQSDLEALIKFWRSRGL